MRALRQAEAGQKVSEICREMGVSQQAFYSWKRSYAGLGLSELREQLREENLKLKTLVADLTLDKHILQEVLSKKAEARGAPRAGARSTAGAWAGRAACMRAIRDHPWDQLSAPVQKST